MFEEAEFISSWRNCIKHFYLEDGQLGQVEIKPYPNNKKMNWKFRKNYLKKIDTNFLLEKIVQVICV